LKRAIAYFQHEEQIYSAYEHKITDLRRLASPLRLEMQLLQQESWKLQRFEIFCCRRSKFNARLASVRWICDTRIETCAAKDQCR